MPAITINGLNVKATKNNSWLVGIFTKNKAGEEVWINGFLNNHPTWQKGDVVELDIYTEEYQGVNRLKFKLPEGVEDPKQMTPNLTTDGAMELHNLGVKIKNLELRISRLEGMNGVSINSEPKTPVEGQNSPPTAPPQSTPQELADKVGGTLVEEIKVEDINW
jgi:hypothetical protein